MPELYTNNAASTLTSSMDISQTTLDVAVATAFPASGTFRIIVGTEIMIVTGVAGTTFTVTRGAEGTAAATHANASSVVHILTKGALDAIRAEIIAGGSASNVLLSAYSALPAPAQAGLLNFLNDGIYLARDNSASLDFFGPINKLTRPGLASTFTWDNQNGATIADSKGTLYLSIAGNAANSITGMYKTTPAAPWVLTAKFALDIPPFNYYGYGLMFRASASGKIHAAQLGWNSNVQRFISRKYTDSVTFSADYTDVAQSFMPWMRIADDNTNRIVSVSADGINWKQIHSIGRTDFLTANQFGFFLQCEKQTGTALTLGLTVESWLQT